MLLNHNSIKNQPTTEDLEIAYLYAYRGIDCVGV